MFNAVKEKIKKIYRNIYVKTKCKKDEKRIVLEFLKNYQNFRTSSECSRVTGVDEKKCRYLEGFFRDNRMIGAYYFQADVSPQKYMRDYILEKYENLDMSSSILEVGPGDNPLFDEKEYCNWVAIDKGYNGSSISFHDFTWGKEKYRSIYKGGWENISEVCRSINRMEFDLVCGSHSFEHTWAPVKSLIEASEVLKKDGIIVLFVPDGFSQDQGNRDCTHTLYLIPSMIEDLFAATNSFYELNIEPFRPNLDLVITARKK